MGQNESAAALRRDGRDEARERMLLAHDALALWVARRYRHSGLDPEDLAQEARLGLLRASERFDPERGVRFATYAPWWVRRTLQAALRRQGLGGARVAPFDEQRFGTVAPGFGLSDDAECVPACLRRLPPAEAAVLRLRHGLEGCAPRTGRAVARLFALSPEAVGRIERRAMARLKAALEERRCRDAD
ncbi:MAG: sigma-70 family RNA polymerase sigma factor [Isosphaeraceae bacterium]|nr:sigma-70 family RNA polymerase sigma factor [Isosphaeraceae bacterium]